MRKLIDADDLMKSKFSVVKPNALSPIPDVIEVIAVSDIDNAKAIDDVPVIRCKQCKFFRRSDFVGDYCCNDDFYPVVQHEASEDDYCSFAERRDDGK